MKELTMRINLPKLSIGLILLLTFAGSLFISCQQKAETNLASAGPIIDSVSSADGVMIYYEVSGVGEPAIVFVHGWSCDRSYWQKQVNDFDDTYKVISVDIGGHGASGLGRDNWTLDAFGADVVAVVNKINPDKVVLIGHSMGGGVIIHAAHQLSSNVVGLIGVDTYQEFSSGEPSEEVASIVAQFRADFAASVNDFVRAMFPKSADSNLVNKIAADMSTAPPEIAINAVENYLNDNTVEMLKQVRVPIRAINCDLWPTELENNQKVAASFEMKLMPGVGHFVMLEDPVAFNRLLHEILDELIRK